MDIDTVLSRGKKWLNTSSNRLTKKFGLKPHHLDRVTSHKKLMHNGEYVGYEIVIERHPMNAKIKQVWHIFLDGELKLDHEILPSGLKKFRHQGKLIPAKELWNDVTG